MGNKSSQSNKSNRKFMLINCTYEIIDNSLVQIINDRGKKEINEEIAKK